ncbi:uncharacterized protein LOC134809509 isoform X2 [Pan troglodytes]|uniref:uncharacterized protein LOC134809509 isoform X2 n=1 Tax=Pan troglodytes TaxID=9598 RepID=UPI0030137216
MQELLGEREVGPLTHTTLRTGAKTRGNSTASVPRGRCSPPPRGAGDGKPLGWAGLKSQQLAQSAVGCWVRLAAAGPAQQSRGDSLHLRSAGRRGLALGPLSVRAGLAETALGSEDRGRAWPGPGTAATSFLPSEAVSSSAPGLSTVCCPPLQRALSGAASGVRLACLTSLPSGKKISELYSIKEKRDAQKTPRLISHYLELVFTEGGGVSYGKEGETRLQARLGTTFLPPTHFWPKYDRKNNRNQPTLSSPSSDRCGAQRHNSVDLES